MKARLGNEAGFSCQYAPHAGRNVTLRRNAPAEIAFPDPIEKLIHKYQWDRRMHWLGMQAAPSKSEGKNTGSGARGLAERRLPGTKLKRRPRFEGAACVLAYRGAATGA
jgi:hypothetical protein